VDELLPLVYEELRGIAERALRNERSGHTLQATALVHEAYLRLVGTERMAFEGRAHFLAAGAQAIRRVLIDHARGKGREKRGGGWRRVSLEGGDAADGGRWVDVVDLHEALMRLAQVSERQARLVELRFFGGLTNEEAAVVLGVSLRTVTGDWAMARAWLRRELGENSDGATPPHKRQSDKGEAEGTGQGYEGRV
jgi:RNA polymerase sigma factor (TIGR02999 family)